MSAMLANLSASRRRSLQLVDFCKMRTTLPDNVIAWNGAYTRNSAKTVVQDGALVTLSANQFGTSYDDVTGLYGYVPEPAATNFATNSDGAASTYTVSNVVDGAAVTGFSNGLAFGNNSSQRSATKAISVTSGTVYSISCFVVMDDGNSPVIGAANNAGDFAITLNGVIATTTLVSRISGNLYRVSASITASATASHAAGITKYTGQSARTFRITGIQVETGLRATSYIATTGSTASRAADVLSIPLWVNQVLWSEQIDNAGWIKSSASISANATTAPDGSLTADKLVEAAVSGQHYAFQSVTIAANAAYTLSFHMKAAERTRARIVLDNSTAFPGTPGAYFNLSNGTVVSTNNCTAAVVDAGNGWYRCSIKATSSASAASVKVWFSAANTADDNYAGNGTSGIYVWGAQIEAGSTATTYRKTVGTTLENANNRNIPGFNSDRYTLFADVRADVVPNTNNWIVTANDGSSNNRALLSSTAGGIATFAISSGGVSQGGPSLATAIGTVRNKLAMSSALNSFKGALNATAATEDTVGTMPVAPTVLQIGHDLGGSQFNGFIFSAGVIPQVLTQAQINGLTTL